MRAWIVALLTIAAHAAAHPQDGPDVDARVQIKDDAVTMSLAFNLAFLDAYALAPRENPAELHPLEEAAVSDLLLDFLAERNQVVVDGVAVKPVLRGFEIPETDRSLLPLFPNFGMRALTRARIIIDYPLLAAPERITFVWGAFPRDAVLSTPEDERTLVVVAQMWAGGVSWVHDFLAESPSYTWLAADASAGGVMLDVPTVPERMTKYIMIPVVSLGLLGAWVLFTAGLVLTRKSGPRWTIAFALLPVFLIGALLTADTARAQGPPFIEYWPTVTPDEAETVFKPLHTNIYRSFDYTDEEDVYDALAQSVTGDLLDSLYAEIYAGLEMQLEDGAAVSRVQSVDHIDVLLESASAGDEQQMFFTVVTTWRVTGAVFHWGHSHTRTNEYKARYTIIGADDGWRISDVDMLEQSRIDAVPGDPNNVFTPGMDL